MIKMKNRSHGHDKNSPAVTGKIYGTDSSFHGIAHNTKSLISIFQEFSSSINKAFIWAGWTLGYHSMKFRQFADIS